MAESVRLNGAIRAFEQGRPFFGAFAITDPSVAMMFADSELEVAIFELEHNPWDITALRAALQFMLNRRQIAEDASLAPRVTPMVRVPANGAEMNQWFAKQALDLGAYGIVWPRINTVAEARNAVGACRYPRLPDQPRFDPPGLRGDSPGQAARYWGVSQPDYYRRADVWPLDPEGDILVTLMIETQEAIANLPDILDEVPGVGAVLIGEGDMSQELGIPRQYEHPRLLECMAKVVEICVERGVPVGHPHVSALNAERIFAEGYRFALTQPTTSHADLNAARKAGGPP